MTQSLVTIVIPTYNVERYIEDCLDSVLAQTYKNIECIVIDDASTDATSYLLKAYAEKVALYLNKENKGQGTVRNQGIELAKGNYLLFVDSDDWIEPDTVSKLVKKAEETEVDLIRFNGKAFFEGNERQFEKNQYNFSAVLEEGKLYRREESLMVNRKTFSASPCLYLIRKAVLDDFKIRFPEGILHEDEYFTTTLFVNIQSMAYLDEAFYHRRYRISSTMTEISPAHKKRSFDSYMQVFKQLEKEYEKEQYNEAQKSFLKRQLLSIYYGLKVSEVPPVLKKDLKTLSAITWKDRLYILLSQWKQKINLMVSR